MKKKVRIKTKYFVILVSFLCIGLLILTSLFTNITIVDKAVGYVITPVQRTFDSVGGWFSGIIDSISSLDDTLEENEALTQEIAKLKEENNQLKQEQAELKRLRELYKLDNEYKEYPTTAARIIAKAPGNWYDTFIIDKGQEDGIQQNMVVLAKGGLVGHIVSVSEHYATVQSIIDDYSSVHAQVIRTNDLLFVEGDKQLTDKELCKVTFIDKQAEIIEGDQIVTSSLGDIYPSGILIGVVSSLEDNPHALTKTAYLKPVVDFSNLDEVLIITEIWKEDYYKELDELKGLE